MVENLYYICHDTNSVSGLSVFQANIFNARTDLETLSRRVRNTPAFTDWKKADSWLRNNLEQGL